MSSIEILNTYDVKQTNGHCGKIRLMADGAARFHHLVVENS